MDTAEEVVIREAFPCEVSLSGPAGEGFWRSAMIVVTREEVIVFQTVNSQPAEVLRTRYDVLASTMTPEFRIRYEPLLLATEAGMVSARMAGGCGCSDPLKKFKPLPDAPRALA